MGKNWQHDSTGLEDEKQREAHYGANDGRDSTTFPLGTVVSYGANGFGRPTRASPFVTAADFHPVGELKSIAYANGVSTSVGLTTTRQWPQRLTSTRAGATLVDLQYGYDGAGNVSRFDDFLDATNTVPTLTYDEIDRLVLADTTAEARRFGYDSVGNLTSQTIGASTLSYGYDPATNRLASISGGPHAYAFQYDAYGNVAHNGAQSFLYDDAAGLTCARCGQADEALYDYDGLGLRVKARKNGVTTHFMYGRDGSLLFERTPLTPGGGTEAKDYIYLAGRPVAVKTSSTVPTATAPTSGTFSAPVGKSATVSVTVTGNAPTGTVTFREGAMVLGSAPLVNGTATLTIPGLTQGTHEITAEYSGDANNAPSTTVFTVVIYGLNWLPVVIDWLIND